MTFLIEFRFFLDGEKCEDINNALLYMIAVDNAPLSTPSQRGFRFLMKTVAPLYKVPSAHTVTAMMDSKFKVLQAKMKAILAEQPRIVLTTNLRTETMTTKSFLGLTAHWLDGEFYQYFT